MRVVEPRHPICVRRRSPVPTNQSKKHTAFWQNAANVSREIRSGLLRELPVEELPLYRSWCLVHARGKRLSPVAQAFVGFIREERALISQLAERFSPNPSPT